MEKFNPEQRYRLKELAGLLSEGKGGRPKLSDEEKARRAGQKEQNQKQAQKFFDDRVKVLLQRDLEKKAQNYKEAGATFDPKRITIRWTPEICNSALKLVRQAYPGFIPKVAVNYIVYNPEKGQFEADYTSGPHAQAKRSNFERWGLTKTGGNEVNRGIQSSELAGDTGETRITQKDGTIKKTKNKKNMSENFDLKSFITHEGLTRVSRDRNRLLKEQMDIRSGEDREPWDDAAEQAMQILGGIDSVDTDMYQDVILNTNRSIKDLNRDLKGTTCFVVKGYDGRPVFFDLSDELLYLDWFDPNEHSEEEIKSVADQIRKKPGITASRIHNSADSEEILGGKDLLSALKRSYRNKLITIKNGKVVSVGKEGNKPEDFFDWYKNGLLSGEKQGLPDGTYCMDDENNLRISFTEEILDKADAVTTATSNMGKDTFYWYKVQ